MKLSVVIATVDRAKHLEEAFNTFLPQTRPFDEIIIADSSSNSETEKLVGDWADRLPLIYLKCNIPGAAIQRDIGVKASTGDIVFFLDDDILLENKYVEEIARIFEQDVDGKTGGVSGTIINQTYGTPSQLTRLYLCMMAGKCRESYAGMIIGPAINLLPEDTGPDQKPVEWIPSGVCAYRKIAIEEVSGFGDFFKGYSMCEDVYLSARVAKNWRLLNTRKARLFHKDLGGQTHRNWHDIGRMSVINRWMVVREVLQADTCINKIKLGIYLGYSWASTLRSVLTGKEKAGNAKDRFIGQLTGYINVLKTNGMNSQ